MTFRRWRQSFALPALFLLVTPALLRAEEGKKPSAEEKSWLERLAQKNPADVVTALREFSVLGEELDGMPYALQAASDLLISKDHEVRNAAEAAMTDIGPRGIDALATTLRRGLKEPDDIDIPLGGSSTIGALGLGGGGGGVLGPKPTLGELLEALKSEKMETRVWAMRMLHEHGSEAKVAVPILIMCIKNHPDDYSYDEERLEAIRLAGAIGKDAKEIVSAVVELIEPFVDELPSKVKRPLANRLVNEALFALAKLEYEAGAASRVVLRLLKKPQYHSYATTTLKAIGAPAVKAMKEEMQDEVSLQSLITAHVYIEMTKDHWAAEAHLLRGLKSSDWKIGVISAKLLLDIKPDSPGAIRWLVAHQLTGWNKSSKFGLTGAVSVGGMQDSSFYGFDPAVFSIRHKLIQAGVLAVPYLAEAIEAQKDLSIRAASIECLAAITPKTEAAAAALIGALDQKSEQIREELFPALFVYRDHLAPAREKLTAIVGDANVEAACNGLYLLAISTQDFGIIEPTIDGCLKDERNAVRTVAAYAAGTFGTDAAKLKASVIKMLDDPCRPARQHAALALFRIDPSTTYLEKCAPLLADYVGNELNRSRSLEYTARLGLIRFGAPAVPLLISRIKAKYDTYTETEIAERKKALARKIAKEGAQPLIETVLSKCMVLSGVEFIEYEIQRNGKPVK